MLKRFWEWVKREAHHVRAALWVVGSAIYEVTQHYGTGAVQRWSLKEWAINTAFVLGPGLLFWLSRPPGEANPTPEELVKMIAAAQAQPRAAVEAPPPKV